MAYLDGIKIGDKLYSLELGAVQIVAINRDNKYPILVENMAGIKLTYTYDGVIDNRYLNPTLLWDNPMFDIPSPRPNLDIDTKVLVWDIVSYRKYKRYFSHFEEDGTIHCYSDGATSWSSTGVVSRWNNWELAEDKEV